MMPEVDFRDQSWVRTFTGKKFYIFDPKPEQIDIADIAHALAMQCRYGGHVQRFYSVAEHSCYVNAIVADRSREKYDVNVARWALLHDASEAYIGDVVRPLKHQPEMARYRETEKKIMAVIAEKFKLVGPEPEAVKLADRDILGMEMRALKWGEPIATVDTLPPVIDVLRDVEFGLDPKAAEQRFLKVYAFLFEVLKTPEEKGFSNPTFGKALVQ